MSKIIPILIQLLFHSPKLDRLALQLNIDDRILADPQEIEFFSDLRDRKGVEPAVIDMGSRAAQKELINNGIDHLNLFGPAFDRFFSPGQSVLILAQYIRGDLPCQQV